MNAIHLCGPCNLTFPDRPTLAAHCAAEQHPCCQFCNAYCIDIRQLSLHRQLFHNDVLHRYCTLCQRVFRDAEALQTHVRWSPRHRWPRLQHGLPARVVVNEDPTEEEDDDYEEENYCATCNWDFFNAEALGSHLSNHPRHRVPDLPENAMDDEHPETEESTSFQSDADNIDFQLRRQLQQHLESSLTDTFHQLNLRVTTQQDASSSAIASTVPTSPVPVSITGSEFQPQSLRELCPSIIFQPPVVLTPVVVPPEPVPSATATPIRPTAQQAAPVQPRRRAADCISSRTQYSYAANPQHSGPAIRPPVPTQPTQPPSRPSIPNVTTERRCTECSKMFKKPQDLQQHLTSTGHTMTAAASTLSRTAPAPAPTRTNAGPHCADCNRDYRTEEALQQHWDAKHKQRAPENVRAESNAPPAPPAAPDAATTHPPAPVPIPVPTAAIGTSPSRPMEEFFASHAFVLDHSRNYEAEFLRLCEARGWPLGSRQGNSALRDFRAAQVRAFGGATVTAATQTQRVVPDAAAPAPTAAPAAAPTRAPAGAAAHASAPAATATLAPRTALSQPVEEFFASHGIVLNHDSNYKGEFRRLCEARGWPLGGSQATVARRDLRAAQVRAIDSATVTAVTRARRVVPAAAAVAATPAPADARAPAAAATRVTALGRPVEEFFATHAFVLDHSRNYEAEFLRLCRERGWDLASSQATAARRDFRAAQVRAFGGATVTAAAKTRRVAVEHAIRGFFGRFRDFQFNPQAHHRNEFERLCVLRGWSREYGAGLGAYRRLQAAEIAEFEVQFGTDPNEPEAWRRLCETAGITPIPRTLDERRQVCRISLSIGSC